MVHETIIRVLIAFGILIVGFAASRIGEGMITRQYRKRHGVRLRKVAPARLFAFIVNVISLILALSALNVTVGEDTLGRALELLPTAISAVLLLVLVIVLVGFIMHAVRLFVENSGLLRLIEEYDRTALYDLGLIAIRIILYALLGIVALSVAGVETGYVTRIISFIAYPILIFLLVALLVACQDALRNLAAGYYFRLHSLFREGELVKVDGSHLQIRKSHHLGIELEATERKNQRDREFLPYGRILRDGAAYRSVHVELDSLEKIKAQFIAQHPSHCGPASAAMILRIFGFTVSQEEIGRRAGTIVPGRRGIPGGTTPARLISVVDELTAGEVAGVWIDADRIVNLRDEAKRWLKDDALLIVDYKKSALFPKALKAHYSVCLAVEGDELLILDPSQKAGGVFYADYRRVQAGMDTYSELIGGRRGYIVLALRGSAAHKRIRDGKVHYDQYVLGRGISRRLVRLYDLSQVKDVLPARLQSYLEQVDGRPKVARLWRPGQRR
ncbi:hypothetical protein JXB02_04420 [Candidatus Woesearchaeota archaeon]|nr:hypothetical protein [Candidatus Woesearchaeota archaeon]